MGVMGVGCGGPFLKVWRAFESVRFRVGSGTEISFWNDL